MPSPPPRLSWGDRFRTQPSARLLLGLGPRWFGQVDVEHVRLRWVRGSSATFVAAIWPYREIYDHWIRLIDVADEDHVGWLRVGDHHAALVLEAEVVAIYGGPGRTVRRRVAVSGDFPTFRAWAFPRTQKWFVG